ncbi:hypothetical protein MKX01_029163 [Papaver californicum]|nr:hypothetical protein MKX01_029163 [Papaver californicum]
MGSEVPPPAVTIHVTGFKRFHGVAESPTETIVSNLEQYLKRKGLPKGLVLGNCNVLETAAVKSLDFESSNSGQTIWLHFGVNSGTTKFAIENQVTEDDAKDWSSENQELKKINRMNVP